MSYEFPYAYPELDLDISHTLDLIDDDKLQKGYTNTYGLYLVLDHTAMSTDQHSFSSVPFIRFRSHATSTPHRPHPTCDHPTRPHCSRAPPQISATAQLGICTPGPVPPPPRAAPATFARRLGPANASFTNPLPPPPPPTPPPTPPLPTLARYSHSRHRRRHHQTGPVRSLRPQRMRRRHVPASPQPGLRYRHR